MLPRHGFGGCSGTSLTRSSFLSITARARPAKFALPPPAEQPISLAHCRWLCTEAAIFWTLPYRSGGASPPRTPFVAWSTWPRGSPATGDGMLSAVTALLSVTAKREAPSDNSTRSGRPAPGNRRLKTEEISVETRGAVEVRRVQLGHPRAEHKLSFKLGTSLVDRSNSWPPASLGGEWWWTLRAAAGVMVRYLRAPWY